MDGAIILIGSMNDYNAVERSLSAEKDAVELRSFSGGSKSWVSVCPRPCVLSHVPMLASAILQLFRRGIYSIYCPAVTLEEDGQLS